MTQHLTSLVERLETEMLPETRCAVTGKRYTPIKGHSMIVSERREAAQAIRSLNSEVMRLREGLNAIIDRGPERDVKWSGMNARDIALASLQERGG